MLKKYLWSTHRALGTAQSMGNRTQIKAGSRSPGVYVLVGELQDIPVHEWWEALWLGRGAVWHRVVKEWHLSRDPSGEEVASHVEILGRVF